MRSKNGKRYFRSRLVAWALLILALGVPIALAVASPLHAWRHPIYIAGGFAGVVALSLLLIQPLLIGGYLSGLHLRLARQTHWRVGALLLLMVLLHVGGLWIANPPDMIDALLFSSPTPFSNWGVIAMWALFATALLAMFRRQLRLRPQHWRITHGLLAVVIVTGTVVHAILIEGAMETMSKAVLCTLVVAATIKLMFDLRLWSGLAGWTKRIISLRGV